MTKLWNTAAAAVCAALLLLLFSTSGRGRAAADVGAPLDWAGMEARLGACCAVAALEKVYCVKDGKACSAFTGDPPSATTCTDTGYWQTRCVEENGHVADPLSQSSIELLNVTCSGSFAHGRCKFQKVWITPTWPEWQCVTGTEDANSPTKCGGTKQIQGAC